MRDPLISRITLFTLIAFVTSAWQLPVIGGIYEDLGQPVIGAWRQGAWVHWDPMLKTDLLWSQECSQDGAILYALDLTNGEVLEELDVPAREISDIRATPDGVLYIAGVSGLTQPGNELLRFDPQRRTIERLGFPQTPRNRIASLLIAHDGNVYVGTHQEGRLFRYRVARGVWDDLGQMVPAPVLPRQNVWLNGLQQITNGTIFASVTRSPKHQTVAIDTRTGQFRDVTSSIPGGYLAFADGLLEVNSRGFKRYNARLETVDETVYGSMKGGEQLTPGVPPSLVSADSDGGLLLRAGLDLFRVDGQLGSLQRVGSMPFQGIVRLASQGHVVVFDRLRDRFAVVDLSQGTTHIHQAQYEGKRGTQICGLAKASDGSIYGTNIIGMHIFRHDPRTGLTADLGHVGWPGGEVYNTIDHAGQIFFGTYGGGYWGVYDPQRPWKPDLKTAGKSAEANPRNLGRLGGTEPNAVNRPFEYVSGPNGKIYIASRANYRTPGGALVEFEPRSNEMRVFRDLKRSIQTVTADDRFVFAGTNIHGGRGSGVLADVATLFVHDPLTGARVFEEAVVPESKSIVCLRYNAADNKVYGSTDNQILFAFDPRSFEIEATWPIRSAGSPLAGVPEDVGMIHLTAARDGNIYGVTRTDFFRLSTGTGDLEYLDSPPIPDLYQIVEGAPGVFYMGARSHLLKYTVETPAYFR